MLSKHTADLVPFCKGCLSFLVTNREIFHILNQGQAPYQKRSLVASFFQGTINGHGDLDNRG